MLWFLKIAVSFDMALLSSATQKNCFRGFANNKGAGQPAHQLSLINAFVIPFLESMICQLGVGKFQFSSWSL